MQLHGSTFVREQNSNSTYGTLDIDEYLQNSQINDQECPNVLDTEIEKVLKKVLGKIGFNAERQDNNNKTDLLTQKEGHYLAICELGAPEPSGHCVPYLVWSKGSEKRRLLINNFPNQDSVEILDAGIRSLTTDFEKLVSPNINKMTHIKIAKEIFRKVVGDKDNRLRHWFKINMGVNKSD
mmetsp:Transcript_6694/g.16839  ORF Transcript_6694/g.16839 Transcript_6694/m.16839 type:complete len:181 (-) Transcript_6694:148-690(-)